MSLSALIVDDEALARARLRTLLGECREPDVGAIAEAADATQALALLQQHPYDVLLLDIHMPGTDGLALAQALRARLQPPAVVFVTAYAEHALKAFELEAMDYLTKPVRLERLQQALRKVQRRQPVLHGAASEAPADFLLIQERGRTERVPLAEVLYLKAELKYVTVRTAARSHILDGSLNELEATYPAQFLRIHRNTLVARAAVRALERHHDPEDGEGWAVRLHGVDELLPVSRRQLAAVRAALGAG
jgi:two-component system response regulator AlgR